MAMCIRRRRLGCDGVHALAAPCDVRGPSVARARLGRAPLGRRPRTADAMRDAGRGAFGYRCPAMLPIERGPAA
jgi:hypothetical protein